MLPVCHTANSAFASASDASEHRDVFMEHWQSHFPRCRLIWVEMLVKMQFSDALRSFKSDVTASKAGMKVLIRHSSSQHCGLVTAAVALDRNIAIWRGVRTQFTGHVGAYDMQSHHLNSCWNTRSTSGLQLNN